MRMMHLSDEILHKLRKYRNGLHRSTFARDRCGVAVVEMALTLPLLLILLLGILSGGSWLALAHAVQQSANDGARAAIAGLTQAERERLAGDTARAVLARTYNIAARDVSVAVQDDGQRMIVGVTYDGSANPVLSLPVMPAVSRRIERHTSILLTGL